MVWKEAKNNPNPYPKSISDTGSLDELIQESEKALSDLKSRGYSPLRVFQRFQKTGMRSEYRSLYNFSSCDAHSNIRALANRHLEIRQDDFVVNYYKNEPLENFFTYIDSAAGLLTDASSRIHVLFKTGKASDIEKVSNELDAMRSQ